MIFQNALQLITCVFITWVYQYMYVKLNFERFCCHSQYVFLPSSNPSAPKTSQKRSWASLALQLWSWWEAVVATWRLDKSVTWKTTGPIHPGSSLERPTRARLKHSQDLFFVGSRKWNWPKKSSKRLVGLGCGFFLVHQKVVKSFVKRYFHKQENTFKKIWGWEGWNQMDMDISNTKMV